MHRDLSVLESWVRIRKGSTQAQESLSLRYASKPPSLVLFLSLKRKNFMISLVSFLCMTTIIPNITMAGLFLYSFDDFVLRGNTFSEHTTTTLPSGWFEDQFDTNRAFSALRAEISDNATLPSWTIHDQSLMPVESSALDYASAPSSGEIFNVTTSAIASSLKCTALPSQVAPSSSGPGVFTDEQGTRSIRYKPIVPDTAIDYKIENHPFDRAACPSTKKFPDITCFARSCRLGLIMVLPSLFFLPPLSMTSYLGPCCYVGIRGPIAPLFSPSFYEPIYAATDGSSCARSIMAFCFDGGIHA